MAGGGQSSHRNWNVKCKIYIGGLRDDANRYDLEDAFAKYGPIKDVWVARKPPGFAFIEMEDERDAEDAVRGLDGTKICDARVKVQMSNGGKAGEGRGRSRSPRRRVSKSRSPPVRRRRSPSYRSMSPRRSPSPRRERRRSRSRD